MNPIHYRKIVMIIEKKLMLKKKMLPAWLLGGLIHTDLELVQSCLKQIANLQISPDFQVYQKRNLEGSIFG